jgi:serine/threonine protein kinase
VGFEIGDTFGDFQVIGLLGAGGMGAVYRVRNMISDRVEALKVLLPDLTGAPELAERFTREIKIQASLAHPYIASLHTAMRINNQLVMLMELVEGVTLEQRLANGLLTVGESVEYFSQVLSALEYAHARGIIHRDIKPANIILTPNRTVKLMDFGIASNVQDARLTQAGMAIGSLYYMSPEQVRSLPLDGRSDLYSLGVTLYEATTGRRPIDGDSSYNVMNAHLEKVPEPPAAVNPKLPILMSQIILKALEKQPSDRFQTAAEMRQALEQLRTAFSAAIFTPATAVVTPSSPQWSHEVIARLRKEYAGYVGPLAKVLIDRAAKKATSLEQLYAMLATEIPEERDRQKFLATRPK